MDVGPPAAPPVAPPPDKALPDHPLLYTLFDEFDKDRNDCLDNIELERLLTSMGFAVDQDYVGKVVKKFDANHSGTLDRTDWPTFHAYFVKTGAIKLEEPEEKAQASAPVDPVHDAPKENPEAAGLEAGDAEEAASLTEEAAVREESDTKPALSRPGPAPNPPPSHCPLRSSESSHLSCCACAAALKDIIPDFGELRDKGGLIYEVLRVQSAAG